MLKQLAATLFAVALLRSSGTQAAFAYDDAFCASNWGIGQAGDQFACADTLDPPIEQDARLKRFLENGNYAAASARYLQLAHTSPWQKEYCLGYHELYSGDPNKAAFYLHNAISNQPELENVVAWLHRQGHDDIAFKMLKMRSDDWPGGPANDTIGQAAKQKLLEDFLADRTRPIETKNLNSFGMKRLKQNHIAVYFVPRSAKFDKDFQRVFLDALQQWCASSNLGLSVEVVNDQRKANMVAKWSEFTPTLENNFFDTGGARACGILGYCRTVSDSQDKDLIAKATVEIPVFLQIGTYMRDLQCSEACLHQIGHAIGIVQHSNRSEDVLGLRHTGDARPLTRLTEHDRTMARVLYAPNVFRRALISNRLCWRPPSKLHIAQDVGWYRRAEARQARKIELGGATLGTLPTDAFEAVEYHAADDTDFFKPASMLNKALDDPEDAPLDEAGMGDQFCYTAPSQWNTGSQTQAVRCKHSLESKHQH